MIMMMMIMIIMRIMMIMMMTVMIITIRDGPLEKVIGGGGCGEFSAYTNLFFAHCLCRNFVFR